MVILSNSKKVFVITSILLTICLSCSTRHSNANKVNQILAKDNNLMDSIVKPANEYKIFLLGVSFEKKDTLLHVTPIKNDCIPKLNKAIYIFNQGQFTFIFTNKRTIQLVFGEIRIKPIEMKLCKLEKNCNEYGDCPIMLFSVKNKKFKKIKGFDW